MCAAIEWTVGCKGLMGEKTRSVEEELCSAWQVLGGEWVSPRGDEPKR